MRQLLYVTTLTYNLDCDIISFHFLLQDIVATKMEGEPKVKNVMALSQKVLPNTAHQGKDIVMRETDALKDDWDAFVNALQKVNVI